MAVLLARKKQLAAKIEGTKGSVETLANTDCKVLAENLTFAYAPAELVRNPLRSTISPLYSIPGAQIGTITCRVELKGSGTATTAPSWGKLLTGCGFNESVNTTNVTYTLDSDDADTETLTMAVYEDGLCNKIYGARGNVSFTFTANQLVYADFTFTGIFSSRSDVAMLTGVTYESTIPVPWKAATLAFNFGTSYTTAVLSSLTLDVANTVTLRENANASNGLSYATITAREPAGTLDPDLALIATQDWLAYLNAATLGSASWVVGSAAGNKITFSAPKMQIVGIGASADREGVAIDPLSYKLRANAGDDELVITTA